MTSSVALYEALTSATDDRARARVIAEAFERLEERYPHLPDLATQAHLRETELRLQKEIEVVRREIEGVRREIEQIRAELKADCPAGTRPTASIRLASGRQTSARPTCTDRWAREV
jgi:hypothetical protein